MLSVLLAVGAAGFATTSQWVEAQAQAALVRVDIDLTEKTREVEPEDMPGGAVEVEIEPIAPAEDGAPLRVLIYHSHTYEAFEPDFPGQYAATERWRTADPAFNVVRLGAELARILREDYGMAVVHDDTAFEPPVLNSAYTRSLEALENYFARGEVFDLYIDLHRDAYAKGRFDENTVEGRARLMFLVGDGSGTWNGQAFAQQPDWEANLARAQKLTDAVNALADAPLCREPKVKTGRYNQHVSPGALLVEVGNNMNSLAEALASVPILAQAIAETLGGTIQYPVSEN